MPDPERPIGRLLAAALLCALAVGAMAARPAAPPARAQWQTPGPAAVALRPAATLAPAVRPAAPATPPGPPGASQATATRTPTPINLGNFVWDDLDRDGRQDAGEPGLPNVTVQLWNSAKTLMYGQTTTSASGNYTLVAPLPGTYRIRVLLPSALDQFSPKDQAGGVDTADSDINPSGLDAGFTDAITIASNVISITSIDAGIIVFRPPTATRTPTPINLGNLVWFDVNGDGVQGQGEPGLANITVQLWNSTKTQLLSQTTTSASGNYTLVAPLPGTYRIRVLPPAGASFAPKDVGADTADSDINPSGLNAGFTDVITIASNVISITSIDAGLINVPPTPTGSPPTATPTATATAEAEAEGPVPRAFLPMLRRP